MTHLRVIDGGKPDRAEDEPRGILAYLWTNVTDVGGTMTEASFHHMWASLTGRRHLTVLPPDDAA